MKTASVAVSERLSEPVTSRERDRPPVIRGLAAALSLVVLAACGARSQEVTYHDPNMDFSLVRSVAVMPLANFSRQSTAADRVRDVLMNMLQATGAMYVMPSGEVARGVDRLAIEDPTSMTGDEIVSLAKNLGVDAVIVGSVREYGEIRSGTSNSNAISISMQMMEAETGRVVWNAASTRGGVGTTERLFGGGGQPMNAVTQEAVNDLLDQLFND